MVEEDRNLYGRAVGLDRRGRHKTFGSALDAALADLVVERNDFFEQISRNWRRLFPDQPIRPGRYEDGKIFLYVRNAPTLFMMRPRLPLLRRRLAELPGAPARMELRLEAHAQ